eukprot:1155608-Pelagomonas_calceolata.AAC.4
MSQRAETLRHAILDSFQYKCAGTDRCTARHTRAQHTNTMNVLPTGQQHWQVEAYFCVYYRACRTCVHDHNFWLHGFDYERKRRRTAASRLRTYMTSLNFCYFIKHFKDIH